METEGDYTYWERVLAGERVPIVEDEPQPGWYRLRRVKDGPWHPVAIWVQEGRTWALESLHEADPVDVWNKCASKPITYEAYEYYEKNRRWPDEIEPAREALDAPPADPLEEMLGHNKPPASALEEADQLVIAVRKLIEKPIDSEFQAGLFKTYRDRLLKIMKTLDEQRAHQTAAQRHELDKLKVEIAEIESPYRAAADNVVAVGSKVRDALTKWLTSQKESAPARVTSSEGGRATTLRTMKSAKINDWLAVISHYAENDKLRELVQKLANADVRAGNKVPGAEIIEERKAV